MHRKPYLISINIIVVLMFCSLLFMLQLHCIQFLLIFFIVKKKFATYSVFSFLSSLHSRKQRSGCGKGSSVSCRSASAEEIRCIFDDNSKIIFVKSS